MPKIIASLFCLTCWISIATAQDDRFFDAYLCTIKNSYVLSPSGAIADDRPILNGGTFVVERKTGKMLGDLSSEAWIGRKEVLDVGSGQQSYKALYLSPGPFVHVRLLEVMEYLEQQEKPFVLMDDSDMYAGMCRHT